MTSEWVSVGHSDKTCDMIASYLLDRYLERDPKARYAMEVQAKDNHITLGGEVTSAYEMHPDELKQHVRDVVCGIGYTPEYAARWGQGNCIDPDALDIVAHIGQQSPQIAQGVDDGGWGDQGIFWGMATGTEATGYMPLDHTIARRLGMALYEEALKGELPIGLDIKTQVTVEDGKVAQVIVAVPTLPAEWCEGCTTPHFGDMVRRDNLVHEAALRVMEECGCGASNPKYIINGTGAYVRHSTAGDCGTTGRKLAVDFYGGNARIGGGCPWGKDPSKADVTLNVYARHLALEMQGKVGGTVYCAIHCCIGRREIGIAYYDAHMNEITRTSQDLPASEIVDMLDLRRPVWAYKCANGLFAVPDVAIQ
jgi:S-adenosylmethionine synthetase